MDGRLVSSSEGSRFLSISPNFLNISIFSKDDPENIQVYYLVLLYKYYPGGFVMYLSVSF